jgi:hypothetical protein
VDAVLAHTPSRHHNEVAGFRPLKKKFPPVVYKGHHADGTDKHERLADIAVVKTAPSLRCGDARTVAADTDSPDHAVKDLAGGKDRIYPVFTPEQFRIRFRIPDAVPVIIEAGFCPEAKPYRVAVHPDNPGQGPAKRVQG